MWLHCFGRWRCWRHNERDGVSNHRRLDCLPNRLFSRRSKKISKPCVPGLCERNPPVTGGFPSQRASKKVAIWWRHYELFSRTPRRDVLLIWVPINYATVALLYHLLFMNVYICVLYIHYGDVIMVAIASQITNLTIVYSTVYSDTHQRKHQSSASLAFVCGNSPGTGEFPAQMASNAQNVSIWWRNRVCTLPCNRPQRKNSLT